MKKTSFYALGALLIAGLAFVSCNNTASAPKASLKNSVDSVSYAYGVSMADQGLTQYLEQMGVLQSSSNIEYDYQMRIAAADSVQKIALEKELKTKLDSLNKVNGPKLNEFLKGLKDAIHLEEKSPYAQGLSIGIQFSQQMLPQFNGMLFAGDSSKSVNTGQLLAGLTAVLKNQQTAIAKMDAGTLVESEIEKAQQRATAQQEESLKTQYADSIAAGKEFLAENAKRPEVVTLPSGLQYEVLKAGNGATPSATDQVRVHYHGTLINGTVFDSSVTRGEPAVFGVNQVIPGWTEALQLMPVGSKWKLYIPYDLAYGAQDMGTIKPFSNLVFDVELLGIEQ